MGEGERSEDRVSPPDPGTMQCGDTPPPPDQCYPTMDPGKGEESAGISWPRWHFMALCLAPLSHEFASSPRV